MYPLYWILDEDKNIVPLEVCPDMSHLFIAEEWLKDNKKRVVGHTQIGEYEVSTVFLVLAHCNPLDNDFEEPYLFETMVFNQEGKNIYFTEKTMSQKGCELLFGRDFLGNCARYRTWAEAVVGHQMAVRAIATFEGLQPINLLDR